MDHREQGRQPLDLRCETGNSGCGTLLAVAFFLFVGVAVIGLGIELLMWAGRPLLLTLAAVVVLLLAHMLFSWQRERFRYAWHEPELRTDYVRETALGTVGAVATIGLVTWLFMPLEPDAPSRVRGPDAIACEAVFSWYEQDGPNPSDEQAGRELRQIAALADSDRIRSRIIREAHMWETGVLDWGDGAQEACLEVIYAPEGEPDVRAIDTVRSGLRTAFLWGLLGLGLVGGYRAYENGPAAERRRAAVDATRLVALDHQLRDELDRAKAAAKAFESHEPGAAVETYRETLEGSLASWMGVREQIEERRTANPNVRGSRSQISRGEVEVGDPEVVYRLALTLQRMGDEAAAVQAVDQYLDDYPRAGEHHVGRRAVKLRDRLRANEKIGEDHGTEA